MVIPIWPSDMCIFGDDVWIFHGKLNGFFRYNLKEKTLYFVDSIVDEPFSKRSLFCNIISHKDQIVLVPYSAKEIHIFDIENFKLRKLKNYRFLGNSFVKAVLYNDFLYCIPHRKQNSNGIVRINLNSEETSIYDEFWSKLPSWCTYINDLDICNNIVVGVIGNSASFFIYDLETKDLDVIDLKSDNILNTVIVYERILLLYGKYWNKIIVYDIEEKKIARTIAVDTTFGRLLKGYSNQLILDDAESCEFDIYDIYNGCLIDKYISQNKKSCVDAYRWEYGYGVTCQSRKDIYYYDRNSCSLIKFNQDGVELTLSVELCESELRRWRTRIVEYASSILEEETISDLEDYIRSR